MSTSCTTSSAVGDDVHTAVVSVSILSFLSVSVLKKEEHLFNYKSTEAHLGAIKNFFGIR